ncbi:hypothetical protein LL038_05975 [Clostridium estertheticum]|uniref:Uncharacterized protein n=1 Tax=Clostridium estertheticum TaxID=238834 RepID=A0AA47I6P7_9CLOT|nr:hypothetical protein [Clostridium estertheticum]MBU3154628.1 hypothetical protein [Clostridium estertheticum]WAG61792.1 hypothetical protein LL038_05975 [Clostridium estertheticum]
MFKLMQNMFESAYTVQCYPGDDGIDIYVREKEKTIVYQCKYFVDSKKAISSCLLAPRRN